MAGPLGFSVSVIAVGIPGRIGGYVFLEVVAKVLFIIAWVIRPDTGPAALAGNVGDVPRGQGNKPVCRQRPIDPAAAGGVPDPPEHHAPRFVAADASVAPLSLATTLQVRVHTGIAAPLVGTAGATPANIVR
jgi:hypothetical protein